MFKETEIFESDVTHLAKFISLYDQTSFGGNEDNEGDEGKIPIIEQARASI